MAKRKKLTSKTTELPELFKERLKLILQPTDLIMTLSSFSKERNTTLRVNTLKTDAPTVQKWLQQHGIPFVRHNLLEFAFVLPKTTSREATEWDIYKEGKIYLQNLSSMIPPLILNPQPGESILDLTAAPGSKTTQMAAMMQAKGKLTANDKNYPRYKRLEANVAMQVGGDFVKIHNLPGEVFGKQYAEQFDRVLIDAPCSSEGQFSLLQPKTLHYWTRHKIKEMVFKQNKLLYSAIHACKPGGLVVYSTCTFAPEENEMVVSKMLKKFEGQIKLEPIELKLPNVRPGITKWNDKELDPTVKMALRVIPTQEFEGFFVAKIRKLG